MKIGESIKKLRKSRKLSGKIFSENIGKTTGWLSRVEHGQIEPSASIIMLIEEKYGLTLTDTSSKHTAALQGERHAAGVSERKFEYWCLADDIKTFVDAVVEILTTDNEYSGALKENILAFQRAVRHDREMGALRRDLDAIKKVLHPGDPLET